MAGKHGALWNLTGICDAILSSRYELRSNKDLLLGLVEFWCPETNTFVFPWGEATVTLEDVMILGGFSTLGESVRRPLERDLVKIEEEMGKKRSILTRNKSKKANHSSWIKHFMGEEEREYEHVAFLSLWLSRYSNWWKKCDLARKEALRGIDRNQNSSSPLALAKRNVEKSPASNKVGVKKPQNLVSKLEGCCSSFINENASKASARPKVYGRMYHNDEPHNPRMPRETVRQMQKIIKPRVSPPVQVERAKSNSKDPASMCGLRRTCSISQVFGDNISQESYATVDPELSSSMVKTQAYEEYSDTDHIPISKRLKHMLGTPSRRVVFSEASSHCRIETTDSPTSRAPQGDVRKRKFSSTVTAIRKAPTLHERQRNSPTSRIPNGCASKKRCSPIAVRRKATNMPFGGSAQRHNAGSSDQKLKRVVQEGRSAFDHATNAMEVSEHRMNVEQKRRFEGSVKGTGTESKTRIGEGIPKKSENVTFKDATAGSFQNFGLELELRLRALEEVVGISAK
ncbi:hypothetical protein CCACVL1_00096 [Corchorus capsularis]|uniref:Aminotransferase-like plant mobile domain-containing protein n=1 Tax=Corchorus capsularis TaxID=210143 RepID=A0A1R3KYJ1_COCAP|nr:hypothetical protein CCACVL1_00096 [Corchorus capsularis]